MKVTAWSSIVGAFLVMACAASTAIDPQAREQQELGTAGAPSSSALPCCPAGNDIYDCRKPDGGKGLACHNPAMGCPSTLTCGSGCDSEVSGRCQCVQNVLCIKGDHFDHRLCKCVPNAAPDPNPACVQNVLCIKGDHFDRKQCRCVPDVPSDSDAGTSCVQNVLCVRGDHFDTKLCRCVPDEPSDPDAGPTCIQRVLCVKDEHFDRQLCRCVPNVPQQPECSTAADCKGILPDICRLCANGSTDCAHFACMSGKCEVALCD